MCDHDKQYIVLTEDQLSAIIKATVKEAVKDTLAELNVKMYPKQSGRMYRRQMIEILGRVRYDEAVREGWLIVHKHDPLKTTSRVYARIEDWERFLKLHTNQKV